jgi:hypothetical protein
LERLKSGCRDSFSRLVAASLLGWRVRIEEILNDILHPYATVRVDVRCVEFRLDSCQLFTLCLSNCYFRHYWS